MGPAAIAKQLGIARQYCLPAARSDCHQHNTLTGHRHRRAAGGPGSPGPCKKTGTLMVDQPLAATSISAGSGAAHGLRLRIMIRSTTRHHLSSIFSVSLSHQTSPGRFGDGGFWLELPNGRQSLAHRIAPMPPSHGVHCPICLLVPVRRRQTYMTAMTITYTRPPG